MSFAGHQPNCSFLSRQLSSAALIRSGLNVDTGEEGVFDDDGFAQLDADSMCDRVADLRADCTSLNVLGRGEEDGD